MPIPSGLFEYININLLLLSILNYVYLTIRLWSKNDLDPICRMTGHYLTNIIWKSRNKYEDASLFICFRAHRNTISDKGIHCSYIYRNFENFSKGQTKNEMTQVVLFSRRQIYKFHNELVPIPFLKTPLLFLVHHSLFIPHNTICNVWLHYAPYILD